MHLPVLRLASVILAVAIAPALAACETPTHGRGVVVTNATDSPVMLRWLLDGEVLDVTSPLAPGKSDMLVGADNLLGGFSRVGEGECTTVPVVALGPGGEEIARADPPLCVGDEWVIEAP
jgi:hypothetical protein